MSIFYVIASISGLIAALIAVDDLKTSVPPSVSEDTHAKDVVEDQV